jgi:hypothetical protein
MHKDNAFGEYSLNEKSVTAAIVILLLSLSVSLISITVGAKPSVSIYLSTDKPYYTYGQSGELYVTVRNEGPGPIEIRKITVTFPWFGWYNGGWDGNETRTDIENNAVAENATSDTFKFTFTIPKEGRGLMGTANTHVNVEYAWGDESADEDGFITIPIETPVTQSPNLTPMLYLMGINTVLLILVLIGLFFVWGSLRKLTSVPPATG